MRETVSRGLSRQGGRVMCFDTPRADRRPTFVTRVRGTFFSDGRLTSVTSGGQWREFCDRAFSRDGVSSFVTESFFRDGVSSFVTEPFFGMGWRVL